MRDHDRDTAPTTANFGYDGGGPASPGTRGAGMVRAAIGRSRQLQTTTGGRR